MADDTDLWLLVPRPLRRLPADLAAVVAVVLLTNVVVLAPVLRETPLRVVLGLPFVLFVPGYAFVAALFPEAGTGTSPAVGRAGDDAGARSPSDSGSGAGSESESGAVFGAAYEAAKPDPNADADADTGAGVDTGTVDADRGIDGIERVALSFGLSIAIVPLIGLVLNFTPFGIRLVPILVAVSGGTLLSTAVGAVRRFELPLEDRFRVPYREWVEAGRSELFEPETRVDAALNVALALSVVLAVASVGYAVAVPKQGETFTEFYLLTQNETGALVADDYPQNFTVGQAQSVHVGIGNNEYEPFEYTVVVVTQDVRFENNSTTVLREREVDRYRTRVTHNETWLERRAVAPTLTGERLRLAFLLYRGEVPADPTVDNAYRELHLWVNVSER